jgi:hypothetical protein
MNEEEELQIGFPAHAVYKTLAFPAGNLVNCIQVHSDLEAERKRKAAILGVS